MTSERNLVVAPPGVTALRWALAIVLGGEAAVLAVATVRSAHAQPLLLALAGMELVACALLVVPRARRVGAWLIVGALVFASVLHLSQGEAPPPTFIVYLAAIFVVAHKEAHDG